jgi:hypothetical protein
VDTCASSVFMAPIILILPAYTRDEWKAAGASEFCRAAGKFAALQNSHLRPGSPFSVPAAVAVDCQLCRDSPDSDWLSLSPGRGVAAAQDRG